MLNSNFEFEFTKVVRKGHFPKSSHFLNLEKSKTPSFSKETKLKHLPTFLSIKFDLLKANEIIFCTFSQDEQRAA